MSTFTGPTRIHLHRTDPIAARPKSINARFEHLSCKQRNEIFTAIQAMIADVQNDPNTVRNWPTLTDFNRIKNALASHYGVSPWTILGAWRHVRIARGVNQ